MLALPGRRRGGSWSKLRDRLRPMDRSCIGSLDLGAVSSLRLQSPSSHGELATSTTYTQQSPSSPSIILLARIGTLQFVNVTDVRWR